MDRGPVLSEDGDERHGVLTVQVAQTQEAAEGIFRMVQRFWERLPEEMREGPLQAK